MTHATQDTTAQFRDFNGDVFAVNDKVRSAGSWPGRHFDNARVVELREDRDACGEHDDVVRYAYLRTDDGFALRVRDNDVVVLLPPLDDDDAATLTATRDALSKLRTLYVSLCDDLEVRADILASLHTTWAERSTDHFARDDFSGFQYWSAAATGASDTHEWLVSLLASHGRMIDRTDDDD